MHPPQIREEPGAATSARPVTTNTPVRITESGCAHYGT